MANTVINVDSSMSTATLASILANLQSGDSVVFEAGVYEINGLLEVNGGGGILSDISLVAEEAYSVTIRQTEDDVGIFEFNQDLTHTWLISGFVLEWTNQQSSSNTDSIAIAFRGIDSGNGFFNGSITHCRLVGGYRGVSLEGSSGQIPVWNVLIEGCSFREFSGSAIRLASPTAIGMPCNTLRHVSISNSETANTEDQVYLSGQSAMTIEGLLLSGSSRRALYADSSVITISGLTLAELDLDETYPVICYLANLNYIIRGLYMGGSVLASEFGTVINGDAGASIVVTSVRDTTTRRAGKYLYLFEGASGTPEYRLVGKADSANANFDITNAATQSLVEQM